MVAIAFIGPGAMPLSILRDFVAYGEIMVVHNGTATSDPFDAMATTIPLEFLSIDQYRCDPQQCDDEVPTPRFSMPAAHQVYRPKITKPQWTPTATAPRRMLRCNRKGIGLRIKTIK